MIKDARHKNQFDYIMDLLEHDFKNLQKFPDDFIVTTKLNISQASLMQFTKDNPRFVKVKKTFGKLKSVIKKGKTIQNIQSSLILQRQCVNGTSTKTRKLRCAC